MTFRLTAPRLLLAAACGAALLSAPLVASPTASAACPGGTVTDNRTGICWPTAAGNITGTGGVCMPGRIGLCMAAYQNSQIPGANLPKSAPGASWP
jgi:hypothetical protein